MLHNYWTKIDYYCCFVILLCTFKLCINSILTDIDLVVDNNCFLRTPNKSWKIPKICCWKINYFIMNCESIHSVINDYIAQSAEINTTNKIYMNSWWIVEYLLDGLTKSCNSNIGIVSAPPLIIVSAVDKLTCQSVTHINLFLLKHK